MNKCGLTKFDGYNIYGYGNVRLAPHYYEHLLKGVSHGKKILDVGCGDGILKDIIKDEAQYKGIDIGADCYEEVHDKRVEYIRNCEELLASIEQNAPDISLLINVLEHTFDFSGLFLKALEHTREVVFISLPNEENVHLRLAFLFGKGINSHTLDMVGRHVNSRHLWLIQMAKAEKILNDLARQNGFSLIKKAHYLAYPTTPWKRFLYRLCMLPLPWSLKARNFVLVFKRDDQ